MKRASNNDAELNILSCELCSQLYDNNGRSPIMLKCCFETACKTCWNKGFKEALGFTCPYSCGIKVLQDPQQPQINHGVFKIVQKSRPLDIICSTHPSQRITQFNLTKKTFLCQLCQPLMDTMEPISHASLKEQLPMIVAQIT